MDHLLVVHVAGEIHQPMDDKDHSLVRLYL
jgi:hypothetical protein